MTWRRRALWAVALTVVAALCIPAVYLGVHAASVGSEAWAIFLTGRTLELLGKTVALALLVTVLSALVALPLAWLTTSTTLPLRRLWTVLFCLPLAVPSFISGYVLLAAFGDGGLASSWGLPIPSVYGLGGATFALTVSSYPYLFLTFRAALLQQDPSLLEAAQGLGATPRRAFLQVTLPRLGQPLRAGGLLVSFYVLSDFGAVSLLQYDTFSRAIYMQLEGAFDRSLAALWSLGLMAMAIVVLGLSSLGRGDGSEPARTGPGAARSLRPVSLGAFSVPALLVSGAVVLAGVALPLGVVLIWLARGATPLGAMVEQVLLWPAARSLFAAALAAVGCVLCALPLAIVGVRSRSQRIIRWLERASYAAYCLPPVVVVLSLVSFGVRVVPFLYGTLAMLILAHVVRFLPLALGAVRGAFSRLSPHLAEAAGSLGAGPLQVASRVTLPLVRPGLVAGGALVFLTAMKELAATLLLGPIGYATLSTRIWTTTEEGRFSQGALPALALMLVSSLSVALVLRHETAASRPAPVVSRGGAI